MPHFSIVIPAYNRAFCIGRAIRSCLQQEFHDFEIVVVDDGSTDGSLDVIRAFTDTRIRSLEQGQNRGVGRARNIGADAATGKWIVMLDSDDELLPGALAAMYQRTVENPENVLGLRFMCRLEDGSMSPDPPLKNDIWDYESFIQWWAECKDRRQETLPCVHKRSFETVRYAEDFSLERKYHLDFARQFRTRSCPDVVRLIHLDANNRLMKPSGERLLRTACDEARSLQEVLNSHGSTIKKIAPDLFIEQACGAVTMNLLAGNRRTALRYARVCASVAPLSPKLWTVLCLGMIGPKPLSWAKAARASMHAEY